MTVGSMLDGIRLSIHKGQAHRYSVRRVTTALLLLLLLGQLRQHGATAATSGLPCEYWGVGLCTYDGSYQRPERCTGQGRRYCDRAPEATACPAVCQPENCRWNTPARFQFHPNHFAFDWDDLVLSGHYDMVFVKPQQVCVQTCWKNPWFMKCLASRSYYGRHYCVDMSCEHDETNRFAGCHHDSAWHAPTCSECARLFPKACGPMLGNLASKQTPDWEYMEIQQWGSPSDRMEAQEAEAERLRAEWLANLSADSSRDDGSEAEKSDESDESSEESSEEEDSDKRSRDDSSDESDDSKRSAREETSSDEADDCDNSWLNYWKSLLRSSRTVECVSINSAEAREKPFNRVPVLDAAELPGVTSFNEVVFQIGNATLARTQERQIVAAFSNLTGAPAHTVQVAAMEDDAPEQQELGSNATEYQEQTVTTVVVVIWPGDPYLVHKTLTQQMVRMTSLMQANGVDGYLEESMSANVVAAPTAELRQRSAAGDNTTSLLRYASSMEASLNDGMPRLSIIIVSAVGSVFLALAIILAVAAARRRGASGADGGKGIDLACFLPTTTTKAEAVADVTLAECQEQASAATSPA